MNFHKTLPIAGPWITQKEIDYVTDAVTNAWYDNANIYHEKFESEFARYVGTKFAIALPSCTSAIHLSLLALGIGPGDEVIVPEITWIATAAPISYVGATPVFADIDPQTWCLSAESFEKCITSKTRAVIPVDLYGGVPEWDKIIAIAQKNDIKIIEDAAEAIGSEYHDKKAGAFGETGVFSFHGSKTLSTGEGGMLVTDNKEIYQRALVLRDHGRQPGDTMFFNQEVAYKYKMSSMQAALGLAQLERIDELVNKKREIFSWYKEILGNNKNITLNTEPARTKNSYWMTTAVFNVPQTDKFQIIPLLKQHGVDTRPFFSPLSMIPAYGSHSRYQNNQLNNPMAYSISNSAINLPSALNLTKELVMQVCAAIKIILQK